MIKHPNIVDVSDFGELPDGRPFLVMELLEGTDLRSILTIAAVFRRPRCWSPSRSARRCEAAHDHGIVHRDLKARTSSSSAGPEKRVKLLDFGIAKLMHPDAADAGLTVVGTRLGTSYTMAPEQIRGEAIDPPHGHLRARRVLYHLLTGQYPFRAETIDRDRAPAPGGTAAAAEPARPDPVARSMRLSCVAWRRPPIVGFRP